MARTQRSLTLAAVVLSLLSTNHSWAQDPAAAPVSSLLQHIEVMIVAPGEDTEVLSRAHFVVTQQGRRYPVRLAHPSTKGRFPAAPVSTHMLLVIPAGATKWLRPEKLMPELAEPFDRGWQISVVRPDGYATPYLGTEAELRNALATPPVTGTISEQLFNEFQNLPGRRVLMIAGTPDPVERRWIGRTNSIYPVYIADAPPKKRDPQDIADNLSCLADHSTRYAFSGREREYVAGIGDVRVGRCVQWEDNSRFYTEGLDRERSLPNALKAAVRDSHNFYDLTFQPDITTKDPITLTLKHMHRQKVAVDTYVSTVATPGSAPEVMRSEAGLIVEQDRK